VKEESALTKQQRKLAVLCTYETYLKMIGTNINTGEEVAIKLESVKTKHPQLAYEYKVYRILAGGVGIPNVRWFGREGDFNVMVMDILGPSLEDLFNFCSRKFTLKTALMLADQMVYLFLKKCNFVLDRDIRPYEGKKKARIFLDKNSFTFNQKKTKITVSTN
ncbi:hypothetical protein RFI_08596, partial [Reticulomyxa filosa]